MIHIQSDKNMKGAFSMRKIICFIFVLMLIACLVGCSNASSSGSVWELADLIGQDDDF